MTETTYKSSKTHYRYGDHSCKYYKGYPPTCIPSTLAEGYFTNYVQGEKNPRWLDQVRNHQNASTPLVGWLTEWTYPEEIPILEVTYEAGSGCSVPSSAITSSFCTGYKNKYGMASDTSIQNYSDGNAYNEAASIFHTKVNNAFRDLQSLVIAGEWNETSRLIRNRGSVVFDGARGVASNIQNWIRRNRRLGSRSRRVRDLVQTASDLWLEYSFGVRPLINDIDDAIDFFKNDSKALTKAVRAIATDRNLVANTQSILGAYPTAQIKTLEKHYTSVSVLLYGKVGLANADSLRLKKLGLHPTDWAPAIYELLPWSFLIDYFTNLGDIVNAVSNNLGLTIHYASRVTKRSYERKHIGSQPEHYGPHNQTRCYYQRPVITNFIPHEGSTIRTQTVRDPDIQVTIPDLTFSLPSSPGVWLNIAALIGARDDIRRSVSNL